MSSIRSRIAALEAAAGAGAPRIVFLGRNAAGRLTTAGVDQGSQEDDESFIDRARVYLSQKLGRPVYPMAPEYLHV